VRIWVILSGDWSKASHKARICAARSAVAQRLLTSRHARGLLRLYGTRINRADWVKEMRSMRRAIGFS